MVDGRDRRVLSETICFPGWGERDYDEEGKDRARDQGKEGGLGERVYVVPFEGGGHAEFNGEHVEDFGVVFWEQSVSQNQKSDVKRERTEDSEGLYAVDDFCIGSHCGLSGRY